MARIGAVALVESVVCGDASIEGGDLSTAAGVRVMADGIAGAPLTGEMSAAAGMIVDTAGVRVWLMSSVCSPFAITSEAFSGTPGVGASD